MNRVLLDDETLRDVPVTALFEAWAQLLRELRRREVLRTNNQPAGDYAEYLASRVLGGSLAPNSEKSFDLLTPARERVQVKARVLFDPDDPGQRQLSVIRSQEFDQLLVVLFTPEYRVQRAVRLPQNLVIKNARWQQHVNGWVFHAKDCFLDLDAARDFTAEFHAVEVESQPALEPAGGTGDHSGDLPNGAR